MNRENKDLERFYTKNIAKQLEKNEIISKVYYLRKPGNWNSKYNIDWKNHWKDWSVMPPSPPEIDLMYVDNRDDITVGIELKYFSKQGGSISQQPYSGIEQALALLQYGFDRVAIWHLFEEGLDRKFLDGPLWYWNYIQNVLELPLDFTFFKVKNMGRSFLFQNPVIEGQNIRLLDGLPIEQLRFGYTKIPISDKIKSMFDTLPILTKWLETSG